MAKYTENYTKRGKIICAALAVLCGAGIVTSAALGVENARLKAQIERLTRADAPYTEETSEPAQSAPDESAAETEGRYPMIHGAALNMRDMSRLIKGTDERFTLYGRDGSRKSRLGVDVSSHQGKIDWQAAAADGIEFAFIRAGYRGYETGRLAEDSRFIENAEGAYAAGIEVGLYFYSQALTEQEAREEAEYLVSCIEELDAEITLPLVFDWENIDPSSVASGDTVRTAEMTGEDVTACAVAFCAAVEAAGYDAAVYGNRWQGYYDYDFTQLRDYAFWVSAPGTADDFYYAHDFWQYSYQGTVPGITGHVDRDLWFVPITT